MHVIFDGRVMVETYTGLGGFTGELLFSLLDTNHDGQIQYTVIIFEGKETDAENFYYRKLREYQKNESCQIVSVPCRPISLKQHFCLASFIDHLDGDIYFYPHFDLPICVRIPSIAVIHDLSILKVQGHLTKNSWLKTIYFRLMLWVVARRTKFVFAVSETTRRDFLAEVGQHFSDKVGVSLEAPIVRSLQASPSQSASFSLPDQFLLYVGDRRPHKNLKRIIDLFILLREKGSYQGNLIIAGSTQKHDFDVENYIGARSDIHLMGHVDDGTLVSLYQRMEALVFLSKYEGFGLPVVEAGLYRKKMIISDGGSLPEVAPPWAFVLPNEIDLTQVVFEVKTYLESSVRFDDSYKKKYTWHSVAKRVRHKFVEIMEMER